MTEITPATDLAALVGQSIGTSDWFEIDQARIDAFAALTGDEQWLHVDRERAAAGPYGTTVAHGYLLLALLPMLAATAVTISGFDSVVNYGLDRVRFPAPALSGSRFRDHMTLDAADRTNTGILLKVTHSIELEGRDRPVCVAEQLRLLRP
jgi:acyl dehydratase